MTKITGKPNQTGPLKIVIREEIPYQTADLGVSPGIYEGTWNGNDWGVNVVMPRYDVPDAIARGMVSVFISRTDTGKMVAKYEYTPQEWIETSVGEFDLGRGSAVRAWVRTQELGNLVAQAQAATQAALGAAASVGTGSGSSSGGSTSGLTTVRHDSSLVGDGAAVPLGVNSTLAGLPARVGVLEDAPTVVTEATPSPYATNAALTVLSRPQIVGGAIFAGVVNNPVIGQITVPAQQIATPTWTYDAPDHFAKDPFVFIENGTYYVYYTAVGSGNYGIGLAAGPSLTQLSHVQTWTNFGRRIWAPNVVSYNGKYYLYYGDISGGTYRRESTSLSGPWVNETLVDSGHFDMDIKQIGGNWYAYATPLANNAIDVAVMTNPLATNLSWIRLIDNNDGETGVSSVREAPSVIEHDGKILMYYSIGDSDKSSRPRVALLSTPTMLATRLGAVIVERYADGATTHLSAFNNPDGNLGLMLCANGSNTGSDFKLVAYRAAGNPALFAALSTQAIPPSSTGLIYALPDGTVHAGLTAILPALYAPLATYSTDASGNMTTTDVQTRAWSATPVTPSPTTTSSVFALVPDMQITAYTSGGRMRVEAFINVLSDQSAPTYQDVALFVDGIQVADPGGGGDMSTQTTGGAQAVSFSRSYLLDLPAGKHIFELRWATERGTLRSVNLRRGLNVIEI